MKEEKFKVIQYVRELIIIIETELNNFPKKDIELKNRIKNISYDILEQEYKSNMIFNNNMKKQSIEEVLGKIKVLDFLLNICYDKMIINKKSI